MKPIPCCRKATGLASFAVPAALAALSFLAAACVFDEKQASSRGTVVDNELRVGSIYLADGSPAAGARVRVFPVGYVPDSSSQAAGAVFSTRTDAKGRYAVDTLPKGEYNILGESDGEYSFQDSVYIAPNTDSISADTLDSPGSMLGRVGLQPQHNPISVVVQVLGTNTYVNVGDDGVFRLTGLAQGNYSLRLLTTLKEYAPLSHSIRIRKGKSDTLKDTLRLPFTGIPVVQGLTATYDTAKGVVLLKWKPVKYRDFSEYVVFRDVAPVLLPSVKALAIAQDTFFYDSLAKHPGDDFSWGNGRVSLEYRVKVKNQTDEIGPTYGKARVEVIDPSELGTKLRIDTAWSTWDPVRKKDSIIAIAMISGTKPITDSLSWYVMDSSFRFEIPRKLQLSGGLLLYDTLRFDATGSQGLLVVARVVDSAGRNRQDSAWIRVNGPPQLLGTWENPVTVKVEFPFTINLHPFDPDDDPVILSAEGMPGWLKLDSSGGVLYGSPSSADTGDYPDILIKARDARHTVVRPLRLRVEYSPWAPRDSLARDVSSPSLAAMGGRLFAFNPPLNGGDGNVQVYDTSIGYWNPSPLAWTFRNRVATPYAGKILLAGNDDSLAAAIYDTTARTLKFLARTSYIIPEQTHCAAANGKLYCLGPPSVSATPKIIVREYDPALDKWQAKKDVPFRFPNAKVTGLGDRVYVHAGDSLFSYNPVADSWSQATPPMGRIGSAALCTLEDKVILASSSPDTGSVVTELQAFNPATGFWTVLPHSNDSQSDFSCAELDGRLYLVGGRILSLQDGVYGMINSGMQTFDGRGNP